MDGPFGKPRAISLLSGGMCSQPIKQENVYKLGVEINCFDKIASQATYLIHKHVIKGLTRVRSLAKTETEFQLPRQNSNTLANLPIKSMQ